MSIWWGLLKLRYLPDTGMISSLASVLGRPPFTKLLLALAFSCHLFPRFLCFGVGLLRGGTGHLGVHRKPTEQGVDPLVLVADAPLALHPISGFDVGAKLPFSGASHQLPQLLLPTFAGRSIPARRGRAPSSVPPRPRPDGTKKASSALGCVCPPLEADRFAPAT